MKNIFPLFMLLVFTTSFSQVHTMPTTSIALSEIAYGSGGGGGSVSISNNILTFYFGGSWPTNSLKTGSIKYLPITPTISNLELGVFYSFNGTPTGYFLKIVNNWLIIYIPNTASILNGGYIPGGSISYSLALLPDIIQFTYDAAGNQTQRLLCINCNNKQTATYKEEVAPITEDNLSYYPNPVKQELNLSWQLVDNTTIVAINVYNLNGQLLKTYADTKTNTAQIIPFQDYPTGVYVVELLYSNKQQKTIKIIKQ